MMASPESRAVPPGLPRLRIVWNYLEWGGANVYLVGIMKQAVLDWDVEVLLPVGSDLEIIRLVEAAGAKWRSIDALIDTSPAQTVRRKVQRQWRRVRAEWRTFRELQLSGLQRTVVHAEFAPWQSWIFYLALARRGAKAFCTMHNALPVQPRWRTTLWKWRLGTLSRTRGFQIFASNAHVKDSLEGWVEESFRQRIPVTYTCVDPRDIARAKGAAFDRGSIREKLGIPEDAIVVLTVGRFIDRKGRWTLLDAARKLDIGRRPIHFVWLTPELPRGNELLRVDLYGLGERFKLLRSGDVCKDRLDTLKFFRIADIFALPSFVEGLPIALLEAMAMGLSCISTNVYAIPEALKDDETGLLIDAGDSDALAASLMRLAENEDLRDRLGTNASEFVLRNFDERQASSIAISEYRRLLS